ncbi:UNVERIFIED_CONTAM: hypothetical protein GTU68_041468 [Idotea baltica]|nr:hypothetical protein [Idotea baltica]
MAEEMRQDGDVFVMGEEVAEYQGAYKITKTLYMSGGQMGAPIVFRGPNGAAARVGAQHSQDYAAWYSNVPGLKVVMPYSAADAKRVAGAGLRDPTRLFFWKTKSVWAVLRFRSDVEDTGAPIELSAMGVEAEIVDLRTIRPMDVDTIIKSVKKTGRCVAVEEGFPQSGVGAEIVAQLMEKAFDFLDAPVLRICGKDVPMPYAANLEKLALPNVGEVIDAVKAVTYTD